MDRRTFIAALMSAGSAAAAPQAKAAARSGVETAYIDRSVAPGDDFDAFANGAWKKTAQIPGDRASAGAGEEVSDRADQRLAELIEGLSRSNPPAGSDARRIRDYYAAFVDVAGIEARGLAPVKPRLDAIAAIASKADLARAIGASLRADVDPLNNTNFWTENLYGIFVTQALESPTKTVPYLMQGGLGLPDRDYFLSADPEMAKIRDAYRGYVADILRLAGFDDAPGRAGRIFELELKIAQRHASLVDSQDIHKANNPWSRADFDRKAPGLDWAALFSAAGLGGQGEFIVWQPAAVTGLSALTASEPLAVWKDWLAFHLVSQHAGVLPRAFDARRFDFYGKTLSGTPEQRPRPKRALAAVGADLGEAVGRLYAERYFPASAKRDVQTIVDNIKAAFDRRLAGLSWMTPATKAEARRKITTLIVGVGYPDRWRDYSGLDIRPDDAFGNTWRAQEFEYRRQLAKIGRPVDRREWWMAAHVVNALNLPLQNALNFPAAILDAPFYDPNRDAAANYGAIGSVIGHEISHSFDVLGAEFDAAGRLRNWWTPEDLARFKAASQALAAQYDAYEPLPGVRLNGTQTLGENIADVAGLAAAYDAYHASLGGKPAPVIDGLTGDQRFFLAFAQSWREKIRDAALRQRIATDVHAPAAQRVATVRNIDAWYAAFDVKPGRRLYLAPKDRVGVW